MCICCCLSHNFHYVAPFSQIHLSFSNTFGYPSQYQFSYEICESLSLLSSQVLNFFTVVLHHHWYILIFMRPHPNTREFSASSTPFPPNLYKRKWIHKHKCIYPLPLSRKNKWTIRYYTTLLLLYLRRIDLFISPIEVVWILPQFLLHIEYKVRPV